MKKYAVALSILAASSLISALLFLAITIHYVYQRLDVQNNLLDSFFESAPSFRYGTVQAVNPETRTLIILTPRNRGDGDRQLSIYVPSHAYIARENLIPVDGIYRELSERAPASFEDIHVGDNVALRTERSGDRIETSFILFGNPL